jgi:prolyl-tRNA synthetase
VAGANEEGYHLLNTNYGRDYTAEVVTDIALAEEGAPCIECGGTLRAARGVEVGNIFQLGTRYTDSLGCKFLDKDGQSKTVIMGSYGIGSGRLLACIAEEYNDEHGLRWPITVAPYQVHLVGLTGGDDAAGELYSRLTAEGIEVLYDDRDETPGVKFNDADLIGLPLRLTVGGRSLKQGGVEFKRRTQPDKTLVPLSETVARVKADIADLQGQIDKRVVTVPYKE